MITFASRLEALVREAGIGFRSSATSWIFECPRCRKKDKLYIRKDNGAFICFVCAEDGFRGRPEFALRELLGVGLAYLQKQLYGFVAPEQMQELYLHWEDHWGEEDPEFDIEPESQGKAWPPNHHRFGDPAFEPGRQYLAGRGISDDVMREYSISYDPESQRVIFPIFHDGKLMGYQGRYIYDLEVKDAITGDVRYTIPKAITTITKGFEGRLVIFGDRVKVERDYLIIVEGPMDALKCDLAGNCVATMGKHVTEHQVRLMKRMMSGPRYRLYIGLDANAAVAITRFLRDYGDDFETYLMQPPGHRKDLGECTPEEALEAFRAAKPLPRDALLISFGDTLVFD